MTTDRFKRLKALLLAACQRPEAERVAYLDAECSDDPELRAEVERILAHEDVPDGILGSGDVGIEAGVSPDASAPGERSMAEFPREIAGYRIVRRLGEGGMGVVYEAEQRSPRRPVALKVIRGGPVVDEHRVRLFQREAQALGQLKHPGIAAIHESGRTEDGQHFFAMELVRGVPLGEHLRKHPIDGSRSKDTIRRRLSLFLQICDAISYAHQRGVIHRDLKPGNILVASGASASRPASSGSRASSGADPAQIKILDFGLARMTDADVAVTTMATEVGKILGTLAYMSPEQARGNPDEIDIRSDVYSLGVLLYEMLTGTLPYDVRRTLILESVRVICEEEPARPSTIERTLRGDLETIVLKALEKEPQRRYQSVSGLAEDLDRYLTDQPILARPPSATYQLRKLVARHRTAVGFLATIVLALAVGLALVTVQNARITAARDEAVLARDEAERAITSLEEMLTSIDPTKSGPDVTVREMLDETAKTLGEKFRNQPLVEGRLRRTVGATYYELGEYDAAAGHLERAMEIRREVLGSDDPETLASMYELARAYRKQARYDEAESLLLETAEASRHVLGDEHVQTLVSMSELGTVYWVQGRDEEAQALLRETLDIQRRVLGAEHPHTQRTMVSLGNVSYGQGRLDAAEALWKETLEIQRRVLGESHPHTLSSMGNLAGAYVGLGRYDEAEALYLETLEISRRVLGEEHPTTLLQAEGLAFTYWYQGRYEESEALRREVLATERRVLGDEHPQTVGCMNQLAFSLSMLGRYDEAESLTRDVLEIDRRVLGEEHQQTLRCMNWLAFSLVMLARYEEAEEVARDALEIGRRAFGEVDPVTMDALIQLAEAVGYQERRGDEVTSLRTQALEISRRVRGEDHLETNNLRYKLARSLALEDRAAEAIAVLQDALNHDYRGPSDYYDHGKSILDDVDFASLHGEPEFEAIVEELGRRNEGGERAMVE